MKQVCPDFVNDFGFNLDSSAPQDADGNVLGKVDSECTLDYVGIPGQFSSLKPRVH